MLFGVRSIKTLLKLSAILVSSCHKTVRISSRLFLSSATTPTVSYLSSLGNRHYDDAASTKMPIPLSKREGEAEDRNPISDAPAAGATQDGSKATVGEISYMDGVEILPPPDKSSFCQKEFRSLRLKNGLRVLLVSDHYRPGEDDLICNNDECSDEDESDDEEEDDDEDGEEEDNDDVDDDDDEGSGGKKTTTAAAYKAAAALSIGCGSREDPQDLQGLMHFLEHMVFMGSEKYPKENGFDDFVTRHGGSTNAFTDEEHTNFHFDIHSPYLAEGLDRFAQFFIAPLMKKNAMEREMNAVDSEFTEAMPDDGRRLEMLYSSLAPEGHPAYSFLYGNTKSLSTYDNDTLHDRLHEYRKRLYSAHHMCLVVQARQPLDVLQETVVNIFQHVTNNGLPPPDYSHYEFAYPRERTNKFIRVEALKAKTSLELTWFMKPMPGQYRTKPYRFLSMLLGHEGYGSLLSYFKKKNWACSLQSDCDMEATGVNSLFSYFNLSVDLTEEGCEHIPDIIAAVFQYVAGMKSEPPSQEMFDEFKALAQMNHDYDEESESMSYVEMMASCMPRYENKDYITGTWCLYQYDTKLTEMALELLNPDNVCICLCSKKVDDFNDTDTKKEKWFGTRHKIQEISEEWRVQFAAAYAEPNPELHLPKSNKFIVTEQRTFSKCWPRDKVAYPVLIINDPIKGKLFHEQFHNYGLPHANIKMLFKLQDTPEHRMTKFTTVMTLLLKCFAYQIMEIAYDAEVAKYEYSVYYNSKGLTIVVSGFPQHMQRYISLLLDNFRTFSTNYSTQHVKTVTDQMKKRLYNAATDPSQCQRHLRVHTLLPDERLPVEVLAEVPSVSDEDVLRAARGLFTNSKLCVLVQGNCSDADARATFDMVQGYIERTTDTAQPVSLLIERGYRELPVGSTVMRVSPVNDSNGNSAVTNYYQGPPGTVREQVLVDFVACAIEERCFDILRTQEQLSYRVHSVANESNGVIGFSVTVEPQAFKHTVAYVNDRIELFLANFGQELAALSEDAFLTLQETMVNMKIREDESLVDECSRNWEEIISGEELFDRHLRQIPVIRSTTLKDVVEFYNNLITTRKFSLQIEGHPQHTDHKPPSMEDIIADGLSHLRLQPAPEDTSHPDDSLKPNYVLNITDFIKKLEEKPYHLILE